MELIPSTEANLAARWRDWLDTSLRARSPFHGTPETSSCEVGIAPPQRVRVIHYGVDPSSWLDTKEDRAEQRRALCLDPDEIAVGVASRLVPGKGHDVAIRAFAAVARAIAEDALARGR